ncbi:MAG: DUF368 domain-containing protein [Ruminococcus sp.]|jgi:putative membrane protein|nr:DUF368 domain-containing protein [Ruminococcus sp.]
MLLLKRLITGVLMGIATMVSVGGGTIAIILNIYDDLLNAVTINPKKLVKNFPLLLPVVFGMILGIVIASILVSNFLNVNFPVPTKMFFFGIVLGSVPIFYKECTKFEKLKPVNIIPFLIGAVLILGLWIYEIHTPENNTAETSLGFITILKLSVGGIVTAAAMVLPGLSGSAMMMVLGIYFLVTSAVAHPTENIPVLLIFAVSVIAGIFISAKPIAFLLSHHRKVTYCVIGGFVLGSLPSLFPYEEFLWNIQGFVGIVMCLIALPVPILLSKIAPEGEEEIE